MSYATLCFLTAADRRYFVVVGMTNASPKGPQWRAHRKLLAAGLIRDGRFGAHLTDAGYSISEQVYRDVRENRWRTLPYEVKT